MANKIHKTIEGETWDLISKAYYKNEKYVHELLKANPECRNYIVLPAGLQIVIPEIDIKTPTEIPPWRK